MLSHVARLAHRRPKRVLATVIALAVVAAVLAGNVASRLGPYGANDPATQSVKASDALQKATGLKTSDNVVVLVRSRHAVERSAAARASVQQVARTLASDRAVGRVADWYTTHDPTMVSHDGRATYVLALFKKGADEPKAVDRLTHKLHGRPGVTIGGSATAEREVNKIVQQDLARAELMAFPLLFLLSLWFFRSLVAALLPPIVGGLAIVLTFLGLRIASDYMTLSVFAINLVTGLGLGLAIDYSLFLVSRYREEIERHGVGVDALTATVATAGRTVLFSSLTVAAALASLLVFPQKFLYSMGVGGVIVAVMAASVALVALPAILALLGSRVNALAPARLRRAASAEARNENSGWWYGLSRFVMRRPARIAVMSAAFMIAVGIPFLGINFTTVDPTVLPKAQPARQVDSALRTDFPPNRTSPIILAVNGSPPHARAVAARLRSLHGVAAVRPPQQVGPRLARVDVISRHAELSESSQQLVRRIRALDLPARVQATGTAAHFVDLKSSLASHMIVALALLSITTLVILFLFTGSLILPLKALVMNVLTLSAAFGILVFVFQDGRLEGPLGYASQGALDSSQPIVLFAVAFGLSTDYGVFLLSRIKEARDQGAPDREAVAIGLQRTGRIVTAAAILFCVAIVAFTTSQIVFVKELGLGTAAAVLLDATIVRALLVPSLMELLGKWNWWAPRPLRRLHARFGLAEVRPMPAR